MGFSPDDLSPGILQFGAALKGPCQRSGTITFDELSAKLTRVNATIGYEPEGLLEKTGDALGFPSARIEGDLKRFRDYNSGKLARRFYSRSSTSRACSEARTCIGQRN